MNLLFAHTPLKFFAQSFWRDEAFTFVLARQDILHIILFTAKDYNPPLYYLIMHVWMALFGHSEISMRAVSLICYWGMLYIAYRFMIELMQVSAKRALAYLALFFFNPVLVYYAYEARMYTMFAFLATLSFYALKKADRKLYLWAAIAGLYTHYFMVPVVLCQAGWAIVFNRRRGSWIASLKLIGTALATIIPWFVFVAWESTGQKGSFWITPPLFKQIIYLPAVLYTGYEFNYGFLTATRTGFLPALFAISAAIIVVVAWGSIKSRLYKAKPDDLPLLGMLLSWSVVPGTIIFLLAYLKPLFLPRYLIFTTPGLILLIVYALERMERRTAMAIATGLMIMTIGYQSLQISYSTKANLAKTIGEIRAAAGPRDLLYVTDELDFHVGQYYFDPDRVYIYNKSYDEIPWYVGKIMIPRDRMKDQLPIFPVKAFIMTDDNHYEVRSID